MKRFGKVSPTPTVWQRSASLLCTLALLASVVGFSPVAVVQSLAQQTTKRPLTHQDYDSWRSIQAPQISRDGKFVAYAYQPQDGDGEVVVRNLGSGAEWRANRGYRPPAVPPDDPGANVAEFQANQARLVRPVFTADSHFLVFNIEPAKADVNKAKRDKKKPEYMPKNAMGIMDLTSGQVARVEKVKNFQVPEDGSGFIAYLLEAKPEPKKSEAAKEGEGAATAPAPGEGTPRPSGRNSKKKEYGSDLVLRNTATGAERTFADVLDYSLSKDAKTLVYAVSSKNEETNGIYMNTPQSDTPASALLSGKGKYQKLTWDEDQTELAFISDKDDVESKQPKFKVYLWNRSSGMMEGGRAANHAAAGNSANEVVSNTSPGFRKDFVVSDKANLGFSLDGSRLFLGAAPPPEPEKSADEEIPADEKVLVDLWHWKDDYIQPMQKVRAEQDRSRSYRAVYMVKDKKFAQLADEKMESVNLSNDGRFGIGRDDRAYRITNDYDPGMSDVYLVNSADGTRKQIGQRQRFGASLSPGAKYALSFDGKDWNSYSVADGRTVNLTKSLGVNFFNEDNDTPELPNAYGVAGWTKDDRDVLIYDRFDVWQVSPDGSGAKNLTDGVGRRDHLQFRYVRLDPKERSIDPAKPLLLHADNQDTRDSGFFQDRINGGLPEKLLMGTKDYNNPTKAKDADVLMFTASRFDEFPDIWVVGSDFKNPKKVSNGDAQRAAFNWGTDELVKFKNVDGVALQGLLLKPDNFDPKKKYPMIVYIYERLSQTLHAWRAPGP